MLAKSPRVTLYTGGSDGFVASTAAPIASEWNEPVLGRDFHPQSTSAFHGARNHQLRIYSWQSLPLLMSVDSSLGEAAEKTRRISENATTRLVRAPSRMLYAGLEAPLFHGAPHLKTFHVAEHGRKPVHSDRNQFPRPAAIRTRRIQARRMRDRFRHDNDGMVFTWL